MTNEDVVFWKWINDTQIGLVMGGTVAHWDAMGGTTAPVKVFDRHASLEGAQIINYRASHDGQWLVLVGILPNNEPGAFKIKGAMQLFSVARGVSQPIEGHAAAFSTIRLENAPEDTSLFSFAVRTAQGAKVCGNPRSNLV
jgi:clathrin heavy chain